MTSDSQGEERPTSQILQAMHEGLSLRKACEKHGVKHSTFLLWVSLDEGLADHYARARGALLDFQAEELEDIGERAAGAESAVEVAGLRLLSDNRKWLLSKLGHKKYGDKLQQEITGKDGGPIEHTHRVSDATSRLLEDLSGIGADRSATPPVPD
jgi:hypothetical protein